MAMVTGFAVENAKSNFGVAMMIVHIAEQKEYENMKLRRLLLIPCVPVLIGLCLVGWIFYVIGDMENE